MPDQPKFAGFIKKDKEEKEEIDKNLLQKMHRYWVLAGLRQSKENLQKDHDKKDLNNQEYKRQLHYLQKQIIFHYIKNIFFFPIWFVKILTPSFFKGKVNIWTNLKEILTKKEFYPLRMAMVSWLVFTYFLVQGGVYFFRNAPTVEAASHTFAQSSWAGGANTGVSGVEPTNRTGWTTFYSKSNIYSPADGGALGLTTTTPGWSAKTDITTSTATTFYSYPDLGVDSNGVVHVVYNGHNGGKIYYVNSNDWGAKQTLVSTGSNYNPKIAIDSTNRIHLVYQYSASDTYGTYFPFSYATSTNAGWTTWSPTTGVGSTLGGHDYDYAIDTDSANAAHVLYNNRDTRLIHVSSTNWNYQPAIETAYMNEGGLDLIIDNTDKLHVVYKWNYALDYRTRTGTTWSDRTLITSWQSGVNVARISLCLDSSNVLHTVYASRDLTESPTFDDYWNYEVGYRNSNNWTPLRNSTVISSLKEHNFPDCVIDSNNTVHEVFATDEIEGSYYDLRYNNSGNNWTASTTITTETTGRDSSAPRIALLPNGNIAMVYHSEEFTGVDTQYNIAYREYTNSSGYLTSGNLISNAYNAGNAANVIGGLTWTEDSSLPSGTTVTVSLRTASTEGGLTGAWTDFTNASSNCSKASGVVTCTLAAIPAGMKDGADDQWFQYKVAMTSDGTYTPAVSNVTVTYVVNEAPTLSGSGTLASQDAGSGFVTITYAARDSDVAEDGDGLVTPSFEYSLNNGGSWSNVLGHITESGYASATSTRALQASNWTTSTVLWDARQTISGQAVSQAMIRVTVNDGEAANSTVTDASDAFALDVKTPTLSTPSIKVVATTTPATITNYATDDNSMEMIVSLNSDTSGASWEAYAATKTISLATDPDTVYVNFRDSFYNTSTIQSATTPETPTNLVIRDLSNISTADYKEFISWSVVALPTPGFSRYDIWRSTDGNTYTLLDTQTTRTTNYYLDSTVVANTTYYYKVAAVDSYGNTSYFSSVVSDNADGQGGTDTTTPTITGVATSAITTSGFTITWDTDEIASSSVSYVTPTFETRPFTTSTLNTMVKSAASNVGGHSMTLTGLTPGTEYFFYVASADPSGNIGYNNNSNSGYSATTLSGAVISNTTVANATTNEATITWTTNSSADSTVYYSTSATLAGASSETNAALTTSHSITITGLTANTRYYFYVTSGNATDNNSGDYYTFVTANDGTGPVIASQTASNIADTTAVITWSTDEAATTQVRYGTTSGNLSSYSAVNTNLNINHSVSLSSLTANTTYYYTVSSLDTTNNATTSTESSFTTLNTLTEYVADVTVPVISSVTAGNIFDTVAVVTWTTDETASTQVLYGTTSGSLSTYSTRLSQGASHVSSLTGLTANTTYYYVVASVDSSGNATTSTQSSFTTLETLTEESDVQARETAAQAEGVASVPVSSGGGGGFPYTPSDKIPPVISNVRTTNIGSDNATVEWNTDEASYGVVEYGDTTDYQSASVNLSSLLKQHALKLLGLSPSKNYNYRVKTIDSSGNISTSQNFTLTTVSGVEELDKIQELGLNETPEEGSPESVFTSLIEKTAELIRKMSGQVSVGTLESGLATQYTTIKELGKLVPLPLIGGQPVVEVGASYAKIFWTTDKQANSLVAISPDSTYRNNQEYTQIVGDANTLTENHEVLISELKPNTTYHYQVRSKTPVSDTAKSRDFVFITKNEELEIVTYKVENISDNEALFSWVTNTPTDSRVTYIPYGPDGNLMVDSIKTAYDKNVTTIHGVSVKDLEGGLVYQIEMSGEDANGNVVSKTLSTFSTSEIDSPPVISQVQTDAALLPGDKTLVQAIISWITNEPSTSQVFYQKGFGKADETKELSQKTPFDQNFVKRHVMVITNFDPGSVYQFQVESKDSSGNIVRSRTFTLLTPRQKESVFQVIMNNLEDTFGWVGQIGL